MNMRMGVIIGVLAIITGCGAGKTSPTPRYYLLGPAPSEQVVVPQTLDIVPVSIDIINIHIPEYLARPQIITRVSSSELVLAEDAPAMRAGVNRGLVYAGFLGSERCRTFTVMGDTTNLAARLQSMTRDRDTAILIDEPTRAAAGEAARAFTGLGEVRVKGRSEPIPVHAAP